MSSITATDLIEELTKLKAKNEEYRHGYQDLIKEKKRLTQELGHANTDLTVALEKAAEVEPLQKRLWAQERETQVARDALAGLRVRAEVAERAVEKAEGSRIAAEKELVAKQEQLDKSVRLASGLDAELDSCRAEVKKLTPYRDAVMTLKQVLK